jgi:hypothetical protein
MAFLAAIVGILVVLIIILPGFGDAQMLAVTATTSLALAGEAIAYLGEPTLTRYRLGLIVTAIGVAASFYLLLADPFASVPA